MVGEQSNGPVFQNKIYMVVSVLHGKIGSLWSGVKSLSLQCIYNDMPSLVLKLHQHHTSDLAIIRLILCSLNPTFYLTAGRQVSSRFQVHFASYSVAVSLLYPILFENQAVIVISLFEQIGNDNSHFYTGIREKFACGSY